MSKKELQTRLAQLREKRPMMDGDTSADYAFKRWVYNAISLLLDCMAFELSK